MNAVSESAKRAYPDTGLYPKAIVALAREAFDKGFAAAQAVSITEMVGLNELMSAIWGVSTQDFGGYSSRDALAVAHALEDKFVITTREVSE